MNEIGPRVTRLAITLADNNAPEIVRIRIIPPVGNETNFCCLWDNVTDLLSGPWVIREDNPNWLNIS